MGEASWQLIVRANIVSATRARARGLALVEDPSSVVDARYDSAADAIELAFNGGGSMTIPRRVVPGLKRASASKLGAVVVSPVGRYHSDANGLAVSSGHLGR